MNKPRFDVSERESPGGTRQCSAATTVQGRSRDALVGSRGYCGEAVPKHLLIHMLDAFDHAMILVTESARLAFANQAALDECAGEGVFTVQNGHLIPQCEREKRPFFDALAKAGRGLWSVLSLRGEVAEASMSVAVVPMGERINTDEAATVLLLFGRSHGQVPLNVDFFAMEKRLSATETSILKQLHAGHRPAQIARKARVADSTVRTQIINIRHKTDTDSIGDLLRVLNALPPVAPLLKRTRSALHFRDQGEMR